MRFLIIITLCCMGCVASDEQYDQANRDAVRANISVDVNDPMCALNPNLVCGIHLKSPGGCRLARSSEDGEYVECD